MAELADALDLGSSGRPWGFKSSHPHHIKRLTKLVFFYILLRGLEKEWSSFKSVKADLKRRQKLSCGQFLRRGSPSPLIRTNDVSVRTN